MSLPASLLAVAALAASSLVVLAVSVSQAAPPAPPAAAAPLCKGRPVTILGTDGDDDLRGTNGRDVIHALGGDDRIAGRDSDDVICGGAGRDLIQGGRGDDKIFAAADGRSDKVNRDGVRLMVGDVVQGGKGDDLIDPGFDPRQVDIGSDQRDRLSYKGSESAVKVRLGSKRRGEARGEGHDVLVKHPYLALLGSNQGDELSGSMFGDQINGLGGRDRIEGAGGSDRLVDGPAGATSGDDVLLGGVGRDEITSYGGHDKIDGGFEADAIEVVRAPVGTLTVGGGPGGDTLAIGLLVAGACPEVIGGEGDDQLLPTIAGTIHRGKADIDLQSSAFGLRTVGGDSCGSIATVEQLILENEFGTAQRIRWLVRGTSATERLILRNGGSTLATMAGGDDRVIASSGNDSIKGGPGEDRLFGGPGHDVARGGSGTDTCREMEFKQGCELPD